MTTYQFVIGLSREKNNDKPALATPHGRRAGASHRPQSESAQFRKAFRTRHRPQDDSVSKCVPL